MTLRCVRAAALARGVPLEGSPAPWGEVELAGDTLRAHIPDDAYAAEAVLRIAYQWVVHRAGGLVVHGMGVAFGDKAVVAIGRSGAGKSTLTRLCAAAGAQVLSDEIISLMPDGTCWGSPFFSDAEHVGSPGPRPVASLLVLRQGDRETLERVPAEQAVPELLPQTYRSPLGLPSPADAFLRLSAVVERCGVRALTFRKDPVAGIFLRDWLAHEA